MDRQRRIFGRLTRLLAYLTALLPALLLYSGCDPAAQQDDFKVVASFYPLYVAAANVVNGVEGTALSVLAPPQAGCLHDYQLQPQDMTALEDADLFIVNGAGLEQFLSRVREAYPDMTELSASDGVEFITDDSGEPNPHAWVGLTQYIRYVENICAALCENDPANAEKYRENAGKYIARITVLKDDMHKLIDELPYRDIITMHEAFPYFAQEFNLNVLAVIEAEPGDEPDAAELAEVIELIQARTEKTPIFVEPQYSYESARVIADETGAGIWELDPVVTGELNADAYEAAMRGNMEALRGALEE